MKFRKILSLVGQDKLSQENWASVKSLGEKFVSLPKDSSKLTEEVNDADCLLMQFLPKVDAGVIDSAPQLKYIGALATGYGNIDVGHAKRKGIVVSNVPGYATEAVAELVFAVVLERFRELGGALQQVASGDVSESSFFSTREIAGKKFGVVGAGRIGSRVAEIARAFGADVCYWSRNRKPDLESKGVKFAELDKLVSECEIVSLHAALAKGTESLLNEARLNKLKSGALLVNLAPNELVDLNALDKRLAEGDLTYVMDHSDELSPEQLKMLQARKNCVIYPPIGYTTQEATRNKQEIFVSNIENFLAGKPANVVD
ncbi:hypothetical protein HYS54_02365 [Candidatus Micrarchaeota archaeon]|nr:hypothetical protein [Candidatus Micrarchaeota archaeon]